MIYECTDINDKVFNLYNPVSVKLSIEEDTPADALDLIFAIDFKNDYQGKTIEEIKFIKIFDNDNNILIFNGIVDEQITRISDNGVLLELHARSLAALLLDNEANPCVYSLPSLEVIYNNHVKEYGFVGFNGNKESFPKEFEVSKGISQWEVLNKFCKEYLNTVARVEPSSFINTNANKGSKKISFSNKTNDSIKYSYISENNKRVKVISEVAMRCSKDGVYSTKVFNKKFEGKDIKRKRYIDCINSSDPAFVADNIINKSNKEAYEIKIICPGLVRVNLFDDAQVDDKVLGYINDLYVSAINYSLNSNLEKCEITLKRRS